jgi:hypothetical protein
MLPLTHLQHGLFNERLALMVCQIEARSNPLDKPRVGLTMEFLLKAYPSEHVVTLLRTDGLPGDNTQAKSMALKDFIGIWRSEILRKSVRVTASVENPCVKR